jgi:hypothetical protein
VCSLHSPRSPDPFGHRAESLDSFEHPPGSGGTENIACCSQASRKRKPGPDKELIDAVVQMKQRNPTWGGRRIAQQMAMAFDIFINKGVVRRILASHYRPGHDSGGPSWLAFIGHMKDSPWSLDLFRCESATLRTHWVLVMMDQYTRRIIGFGVHAGTVNGVALCVQSRHSMATGDAQSSDHDALFGFGQRQANLRILEVTEIKTVTHVPLPHSFVERLIGTIRREYLDRTLFWTTAGLETSCSISRHTSMSIARMLGGKAERRNKTRASSDQSPTSIAIDGNATAEASITRQWLPGSPKNFCSLWHLEHIGRQTTLPLKPFAWPL